MKENEINVSILLQYGAEEAEKIRVFNKDNEWLAALLSGEALKEPEPKPQKKQLKMISNNQRRAIGK